MTRFLLMSGAVHGAVLVNVDDIMVIEQAPSQTQIVLRNGAAVNVKESPIAIVNKLGADLIINCINPNGGDPDA